MYYRLNDDYGLRGWKGASCILFRLSDQNIREVSGQDFSLLFMCDGVSEINMAELPIQVRKSMDQYIQKKIIVSSNTPVPLKAEQKYRYYPQHYVKKVHWSITGRCNFRCRHCFLDAPEGKMGELSFEEICKIILQMEECGIGRVDLTGGEPFVRKDFWKIVDELIAHGIQIGTIYTNGWLVTPALLNEFVKRSIKPDFSISFDGIGWHDWMRGVQGAEKKALEIFSLLHERGFEVDIEMVLHKGNKDTIRETINQLSRLGVFYFKIAYVSETELWKKHAEGNDMTYEEYMDALFAYLPHFFEDGMPANVILGGLATLHRNSMEYEVHAEKYSGTEDCMDCYLCKTARMHTYISPEGRLVPCMPLANTDAEKKFPFVLDVGLSKALSDSFYMKFVSGRIKDLLAVNQECAVCEYRLKCGGGCRAWSYEQQGDLMGPDRTMCITWKKGYVPRIHAAADQAIERYVKRKENPDLI